MASAQSKTCTNSECPCDNPQPLSAFHKHKKNPDGLSYNCKECAKARVNKRYADPETRRRNAEHRQTEEARKKRSISDSARGRNDWQKLKQALGLRLRNFVFKPTCDTPFNHSKFGCTRAEMRAHLESKFEHWMTWDNYAELWQFDHIVPYKAFPTVEELLKYEKIVCWYKNVRPLHKTQNFSEGGNYNEEDKQALIRRFQLWEIEREVLALL